MFTYKSTKNKNNADYDERFNSRQSISFGNVAGDAVENVDEDEKDSDEDGHPARDTLWGNEEADPGHNDEHPSRKVVGDDVVGHFPP